MIELMDLTIAGASGHTSLTFRDDGVLVDWEKTSSKERGLLTDLLTKARAKGFKTFTLDDDEQPVEIAETLPGWLFNRKGKLLLKTEEKVNLQIFAKDLIDLQITNGKLVMEATKDGEWKILKLGEFELRTNLAEVAEKAFGGSTMMDPPGEQPKVEEKVDGKKEKKQKVHVSNKPGGG